MRRSEDQEHQANEWETKGLDQKQNRVIVEHSLDTVLVRVPAQVRLLSDKSGIEWSGETSSLRPYEPKCLQDFLTLTSATPEKVLTFARAWGPLQHLKEEGLTGHLLLIRGETLTAEQLEQLDAEQQPDSPGNNAPNSTVHILPVDTWVQMAKRMEAMIELTLYLQEDPSQRIEKTARQAWKELVPPKEPFPEVDAFRTEKVRHLVEIIASSWLDDVGASPIFNWKGNVPGVRLWLPSKRFETLFAAMTLHLITVISNPPRVFRCSICQRRSFKRDDQRPIRSGRNELCEDEECHAKNNSNKSNSWNKMNRAKRKQVMAQQSSTPNES